MQEESLSVTLKRLILPIINKTRSRNYLINSLTTYHWKRLTAFELN